MFYCTNNNVRWNNIMHESRRYWSMPKRKETCSTRKLQDRKNRPRTCTIPNILFPNNFVINEILITYFLIVFHCCEHKNYFLVAINNSIATISFFANPPYKLLLMSSSLFLKNHLIYGWCCCSSHYYWYSRPTTDLLPMTILLLQK